MVPALNAEAPLRLSALLRLCCSTFEGCDNGTKFHAGCDAHTPTLTVVHNADGTYLGKTNPGNFTFGGFVRTPPL